MTRSMLKFGIAAALLAAASDQAAAAPAEDTGKSIIDPKYRDGRYKLENQDWLGKLIAGKATLMTEKVTKTPVEGKEGEFKNVTTQVADGVDVDAVFKLGRENGLNLDKYDAQRGSHGFAGRIRMTVGNMLRAEAKRRHGLVVDGKFVSAPAEWLEAKGVAKDAKPTHDQKGVKIVVPKPPKAEAAATDAKAEGEAAAIKADAKADAAKTAKK